MRITHVKARGFRGFNEEQSIDLSDPIAIFEGPNGSGKTSMGEAIEWLLYGKTLKRTKGDELSKREYDGSYRNIHFIGPGQPFVEADVQDLRGNALKIRRDLSEDETSILYVDGNVAADLRSYGIVTMYDRPLILQHTLQDFIFMKPKGRYEVLSAMLGLEPLIAFRNSVEAAKTDYNKRLPQVVREAEGQRTLLLASLRRESILAPVASLIETGNLSAAKQHLEQVAQGLVPPGTPTDDLLNAIKATKATKERAQLDWGRYSGTVISAAVHTGTAQQLAALDGRVSRIRQHLADAATTTATADTPATERDPQRRQFYRLGLHLMEEAHPLNCPFCAIDSLTAQRVSALRAAVAETPQGQSAIERAAAEVRGFIATVNLQRAELERVLPRHPEGADIKKIRDIGGANALSFIGSTEALALQLVKWRESGEALEESLKAIEAALSLDSDNNDAAVLAGALTRYKEDAIAIPAFVNAYAAHYNRLDPAIRAGIASAEDIARLDTLAQALERWNALAIAHQSRGIDESLQDLIRETRAFTQAKQKEVLASRDTEIRCWYAMLNPVSDVAYDGISTSTDNLELRAKTYAKSMMAAPNLSTSQLNCIGLAVYLACATRNGTPFKTLVIDDPVQSMDDEHNEAFKKQVIEKLIDDGFHIVLLTHMQPLAGDIEALYRKDGAALFKMRPYSRSGPSIEWKGPSIGRLLQDVKATKDATNDEYRRSATLSLRQFVERFAKDLFKSQTGTLISKRYEDRTWGELKELLKHCKEFDPRDEPKLGDTHSFTSRHLHSDERMAQEVPGSAQLNAHYIAMSQILEKYKDALGFA